ncbi:hypothetical protein SESBI_30501 [Sesbania bispinosa]|nr:hypothetical protein SESBI_30501 [Sesbania bispinosa]
MYTGNVTELAFDDITPEDPDFSSIQGLAEAGLIESRLSRRDIQLSADEDDGPFYFHPESPLSRQDLVSWKMALEKRQLPEADRKLDKPVTKAQAAIALATGDASDIVSEELARIKTESIAENAVAAHSALVAQVEKDINASFEQELFIEREKINAIERMAEEARLELEKLRAEREEDNVALVQERAAIESEMEDEAKRVREEARALEEARDRWERHGIKVVVDDDLRKEASAEVTWLNAGEQFSVQGTVDRAESLLDKLKKMGADIRGKSRDTIDKIIHMVSLFISKLKEWVSKTGKHAQELGEAVVSKAGKSANELQQNALKFGFAIKEGAKRVAGDCREGVEKITQKFTQKFKT